MRTLKESETGEEQPWMKKKRLQFDGKYPWWDKDSIEVECPDRYNTVSFTIERKK
jgi:uncharacterized repeat protein (TIGR04076 family)